MLVYFNNQFIPKEDVKISPDDRGFLFGDGVYEVIRAYNGLMFRADLHLERLIRSLREIRITGFDTGKVTKIAETLIRRNHLNDSDVVIYIQITRGAAPRKHSFPPPQTPPTVYLSAFPVQSPQKAWKNGIKAILAPDIRWARCDIKSVALLPNVLASQAATEADAKEAILVRDGVITEGSHTNVGAVFNGQLLTHPKNNHILPGVTRKIVLSLCNELAIPVKETPIRESDLPQADEVMLLGTTTEVMPVVQVNNWQVGDGKPGPVTQKLQQAFRQLTVRR